VDGLKGLPEAIESVFPHTQAQLCLAPMVRHSLSYVSHRDRKQVATDMKDIYQAATLSEAQHQLAKSESVWAAQYPLIVKSWRVNWARITPMFGYPVSKRRSSLQVAISGIEKYQQEVDNADTRLGVSDESVRDTV
jgi:putative transposase